MVHIRYDLFAGLYTTGKLDIVNFQAPNFKESLDGFKYISMSPRAKLEHTSFHIVQSHRTKNTPREMTTLVQKAGIWGMHKQLHPQ